MLRTKIICTIGPAVDSPEMMRKLIENGMDVARMNFSHGTHEEHLTRLKMFRAACAKLDAHIPALMDTKGPEIRLGRFSKGPVELQVGQEFTLTTKPVDCDETRASVSYAGLPQDIAVGGVILIDDGLVELEIKKVSGEDILCVARNNGMLSDRKGVNVPGASLRLPSFTEQDKKDILFAIENDYDFIAVSFVRKKEDVNEIVRFLGENGGEKIKVIAKIESRQGVENLDEIIRVSDGIMVARGDLGVEIPVEQIPIMQKDMIQRCYRASKPVITATQMLDSMMRNPRPTRAEVTDIANAVYDGTSAIMLSGETAAGKYPIDSLATMRRIAQATEDSIDYWQGFRNSASVGNTSSITNAISHATCTTAMDLNAAAIVAVTTSGGTARRISAFRPSCPIVAAATNEKARRQLRMSWGVFPVLSDVVTATDDLFTSSADAAQRSGLAKDGDIIVVTAGVPLDTSGTTNMLKVQMLGDMLCRGTGLGAGKVMGTLCVLCKKEAKDMSFSRRNILVVAEITDEVLPMIRQSSALIVEGADKDGKAATLAMALGIPVITECEGAMRMLKSGTVVTVDADTGMVQCTV